MVTGPCSAASEERSAGESGSAINRKDRVRGGVYTAMRGLSPLLALAAGLVLAAPAAAADTTIAFAHYAYNPTPATVKPANTATFSGAFGNHPLVWTAAHFATKSDGTSRPSLPAAGHLCYHCQLHGDSQTWRHAAVPGDQHPARVSFAVSPAPRARRARDLHLHGRRRPRRHAGPLAVGPRRRRLVRDEHDPAARPPTTYASAGDVTVRVQAVDDGGERSATAEQALTIAGRGHLAPPRPGTPPRRERRS